MGTKYVSKDFEGKSNLLKKGFELGLEDLFLLIEAKRQSFYFFTFLPSTVMKPQPQHRESQPHHIDTLKSLTTKGNKV